MSGRQLVIVILSCALLWFGSQSFNNYIQNTVEEKKIDASKDKDKALVELAGKVSSDDLEKMRIMADALRASPRTREINELKEQAIDSIIRHSGGADKITIQGKDLDKEAISSINRGTRRKSETRQINGSFYVIGVDSTDNDFFRVRLQDQSDESIVIAADLEDAVTFAKYKNVIQKAEWQRKPIRVRISARCIGDQIVDASIISATAIKKR